MFRHKTVSHWKQTGLIYPMGSSTYVLHTQNIVRDLDTPHSYIVLRATSCTNRKFKIEEKVIPYECVIIIKLQVMDTHQNKILHTKFRTTWTIF